VTFNVGRARDGQAHQVASQSASGFVVGCSALAAHGIFELGSGYANLGTLSAVLVEIILALVFFVSARK